MPRFPRMKSALLGWLAHALLPALSFGASSAESPIVFVADSRGLTGWRAWCTNLYNESLFHFALLTVILIPLVALALGSITNFFLVRSGINLKSRALTEH
jgi:hypothetical protein